jgi:hypothetical protein
MSDKDKVVPEEITGDVSPARGRGRPKLDPNLRLTHFVRLAFTKDQYLDLVIRAADAGFTDVGVWIKTLIKKEE